MSIRLVAFIWIGLVCLTGKVYAQDSAGTALPSRWDLQTCIDYAKKNNITINSLRLNVRTDEQNHLLAKAAAQPTLFGTFTGNYTHSKNANPVVGGFQTESSFQNTNALTS